MVATIVLGAIGSILAAVVLGWAPSMARWIVAQWARYLPEEISDDLEREWLAEVEGYPENFSKLSYAVFLGISVAKFQGPALRQLLSEYFGIVSTLPIVRGTMLVARTYPKSIALGLGLEIGLVLTFLRYIAAPKSIGILGVPLGLMGLWLCNRALMNLDARGALDRLEAVLAEVRQGGPKRVRSLAPARRPASEPAKSAPTQVLREPGSQTTPLPSERTPTPRPEGEKGPVPTPRYR